MTEPTKRELTIYGAILVVLFFAVGTMDYHDQVAAENPPYETYLTRPGVDLMPPPRCPEVYRGRRLSGWIVTEADRKRVTARCLYSVRT